MMNGNPLPNRRLIQVLLCAFVWTAGSMALFASESAGESACCMIVFKKDDMVCAKWARTEKTLFQNPLARTVIEWSLGRAPVTVLKEGKYEVERTLTIPRSGVALVIGPDAEMAAGPEAELTALTEGHARFSTLIHNQRRDDVRIINLGTLDAGGKTISKDHGTDVRGKNGWPSCVVFDGRNGGTCGIQGGMIFSPGRVENCHDAFWVVDSTHVRIPLVYRKSCGNVPLAMEGCENCSVGLVAGLQGAKSFENETLDFNSFNRGIEVNTLIGTGPVRDEILDINNSPGCTIGRVIGYGPSEQMNLVSRTRYGPGGRRLTQKPYIDNSKGTVVKEKKVVPTEIAEWKRKVEVPGYPGSLPLLTVNTSLTAVFEDGSKDEIYADTFRFELQGKGADSDERR